MQTVLVVQSSVAGAVYLNGRMAGEADEMHPLSLPVSPFGALLIELRPFLPGYLPLSVRLPLSHGAPLIASPDARLCAALWPGGVVELELLPEAVSRCDMTPRLIGQAGGVRASYLDAPALRIETASAAYVHPLPEGALVPSMTPIPSGLLFSGETASGQYALVLSPDGMQTLLSLSGKGLTLLEGGSALRLLHSYGDSAGHAALETWAHSPQGWQLTASEPMWEHGAPIWPQTPEATAVAAVEAAQLGLTAEAEGYFSPLFPCSDAIRRAQAFDGCVPLRYPLPGGEAAVGLMQLKENVLHIVPAVYSAAPGGARGAFQLTRLEIPDPLH